MLGGDCWVLNSGFLRDDDGDPPTSTWALFFYFSVSVFVFVVKFISVAAAADSNQV